MTRIRLLAPFILLFSMFGTACVKRVTIAEVLPVNAAVSIDDLISRTNALADYQTMGAQGTFRVTNYFTGKSNKADELPGANFTIRLRRPESMRMQVKAPVIGKEIADMATDGNQFQLAIYWPEDKRQFVYGTNLDEIRRVSEDELKDPTLQRAGGIVNMRPQHISGAYLLQPVSKESNVFREEVRQEEKETRGPRKGKLVERAYYVLYVIQMNGSLELKRKFWFDRTSAGTPLVRQQTFENGGRLASDIHYLDWMQVPDSNKVLPKRLKIDRRNDGYGVELILEENIFVNSELPDSAFTLENTENLKERNLNEVRKPEPPPAVKK